MATNKGYSIRNFEEWKNGGQNGGSSQTTANSSTFGEPQHTTSNKYSVQSFEEWRQNRTSGVTPGGSRLDEMEVGSSLENWIDRYNRTMNSLSGSTTGRWYSVDAINRYGREVNDLVSQFDSIKDYAFVYGFQDTIPHYQNLKKIQEAINQESGWYEKYRGRGHEDIEQILSAMNTGDERDWLEASRYDVYKTAPDYQHRSQTGLAAFENSKPKDQEEESWFEAIGRYLGKASDTTMALGDTGRMAQEYRKDTSYQEPADNWTEDQRNTYGYLYSINPKAASDFAVKTSENYRRAENQQKIGAVQGWATKNGVNASAGTVAAIAMMPLSLADTLNALTEYTARGTISTPAAPTPGQVSEAIIGAVGQSLNEKHGTISGKIPVIGGKGWGDAYQLGTSIANSLLSAYTQGSVGTDILFFGSAASSTMTNAKDRGATDEQAIKLGVLSGLAEAAGEHFSIENLRKIRNAEMKTFFGNVLKQAGIEASEEGFTTLMNNFADQLIMGQDSVFYEKVRGYMEDSGMSEQEAKKQAWKDMAEDLAFDMVGGAISGGVSTGIQTGAQKIFGGTEQAQTHHKPLATEKHGNATELANNEENATADNLGAVDDKMSATEAVAKNETTTVGVSKMETVQQTADIESFAQQFGTQANEVRRNYLEGQLKHEPENLQEYQVGFMAAYTIGWNGGKVESLSKHVPYLSQSQREIAFSMGRDAAAQKAVTVEAGILEARHYGEQGYTMDQLAKHGADAAALTEDQRKAAWEEGRQTYLRKGKATPAATTGESGVWFDNGGGDVIDFADYDVSGVSETAMAGVRAAQMLQKLGICGKFYFFESYVNEAGNRVYKDSDGVEKEAHNGWYDPDDGSIHIDLNAGRDANGLTLYTLSHELIHHLENKNIQGYRRLAEFLVANYAEHGNVDAMVTEKQAELSRNRKKPVSYETAYSEFIADSMEAMLSDGNVLEKLQEMQKTDRSLWEAIKEFFDSIAEKIRNAYKDLKPDSAEGRAVLEMKDQIEQIQQLLAEALNETAVKDGRVQEKKTAAKAEKPAAQETKVAPRETAPVATVSEKNAVAAEKAVEPEVRQESWEERAARYEADRQTMPKKLKMAYESHLKTGFGAAPKFEKKALRDPKSIAWIKARGLDTDGGFDLYDSIETGQYTIPGTARYAESTKQEKVQEETVVEPVTKTVAEEATVPEVRQEETVQESADEAVAEEADVTVAETVSEEAASEETRKEKKEDLTEQALLQQIQNAEAEEARLKSETYSKEVQKRLWDNFENIRYLRRELEKHRYGIEHGISDATELDISFQIHEIERVKGLKGQFITAVLNDLKDDLRTYIRARETGKEVNAWLRYAPDMTPENKKFFEETQVTVMGANGKKPALVSQGTIPGKFAAAGNASLTLYTDKYDAFGAAGHEKGFVNIENAYIVDAKYQELGKLDLDEIIRKAQEEKVVRLDGVIIKNVNDETGKGAANVYIAFEANRFRTVDEVTYSAGSQAAANVGLAVDAATEPEQIKSSTENIGTFDGLNPDIRYQDRASGTSDRELLAGALEGLTRNSDEYEFVQEYRKNARELDAQEAKLQELRLQIRELTFGKGPKDPKRLAQLQEEATKTGNRINIYDKKLLELEATVPLKRVLEREKEKAREAERKKWQNALAEYRENRRESESKKAAKRKIRKTVMELKNLLNRGDKKKNVKAGMTSVVGSVLTLADALFMDEYSNRDMIRNGVGVELTDAEEKLFREAQQILQQVESGAAIEGMEFTSEVDAMEKLKKLDGKLTGKMAGLKDVFARERKRLYGTTVSDLLGKLADEYSRLSEAEDGAVRAAKDENVYAHLLQLQKDVGGTTVRDMTLNQMEAVADAFTMVLTTVRNANKLFGKNQKFTVETMTREVAAQMRSNGIDTTDPRKNLKDVVTRLNEFSWQNLRPVDAFRRLGSEKMMDLFWGLVDGMAERGKMVREIRDVLVKARKENHYKDFDFKKADTYTTVDGKKMRLTLGEKMSIYAYSKREAAFDHMTEGGFTYAKAQTYKDENGVTRYHNNAGGTWKLTREDLDAICNSLTEEQRRYADTMQRFLTEFGQRGNGVSRALFGIDLFKEQNYFPLMSNHDYLNSVQTDLGATQTAASLKNSGFTKSTKPGANNPIVLKNFDDVCMEHLDKMMNYIALTLPLENLRKVYDNVSSATPESDPQSTKALIGAVYGEEAKQYFDQFLKDANGTHGMSGAKNPLAKLFSKSKAAAVSANVSVVIQQISAVVRASAEISPIHLVYARGYGKGTTRGKKSYEEMMTYSGLANIKDMGGFDVGSNTGLNDYIGLEEAPRSAKKIWGQFQDIFGMGAEFMDKVGWTMIWNAVKREVASRKQYTINSKEFYEACSDRFNEIVVKTQVFDSVLSRSGYMRSDRDSVKYLTSFMGEPTVTAGMVFNTHAEVLRAVKNKKDVGYHIRKLARTDAALIVTLLLNGMLKAIPYALRDDDEDESFQERWAKHFGDSLRGDLNPLNLLPVARDISSIWQGRTVERPDLALVSDLIAAGQKAVDALTDEEKREEMSAEDYFVLAEDLLGAVGNMAGVPIQNIWRDVESYLRAWKDATDGIEAVEMKESFVRGFTGEEETKLEGIYDALISGDTARQEALRATYKSESSYESAVRKALRLHDPRIKEMANASYEGDYDRLEALSYEIEAEGIFDFDVIKPAYEAEMAAQAEERGLKEEETASEKADINTVFTMDEYYRAIRSGNDDGIKTAYDALIEEKKQEYYLEREAENSIASSVTSKVKGEYLDEDISRADAKSILTKYGGKTDAEAETEIKKWEFQMEYHYAWGSRDRCYRSGSISRSQLASAVMDIEDVSWTKAQEYVDFLELEMRNEKVDISAAEASSYFEHAKPNGISVDIYLSYRNKAASIQSDKDQNGKTISGSRKNKLLDVIHALPISQAQKDALYLAEGWAESKLNEAPWH